MKRLTIMRHAKSSWDDQGQDDFDRPLNSRGTEAARRMGNELERRGLRFDLVLASPAVRVRETLEGLAESYGGSFDTRSEPRIYMADTQTLLELVRGLPESASAPLLVGHNPGLHQLLAKLARDDGRGLRAKVAAKFPTAALAVIELAAENWNDVAPESGEIVELILPRELED